MWQLQYERLVGRGRVDRRTPQEILDQTIAYARERQRVRHARSRDHQVIAHKLADAATELEAARALLYAVVWRIHAGRVPRRRDLDGEEVRGAGARTGSIDACLQVHGGAGYMDEYPVSRAYRDARL